jgi:hypothetical protein
MALCEVHDVRCSDFEHHGVHEGIPQELRRVTSDDYGSLLHHGGSHFTPSEALSIARLVLREVVWCKMSGMRGFYAHFGYDYYMYLGGAAPDDFALSVPQGLYLEHGFESPYS